MLTEKLPTVVDSSFAPAGTATNINPRNDLSFIFSSLFLTITEIEGKQNSKHIQNDLPFYSDGFSQTY